MGRTFAAVERANPSQGQSQGQSRSSARESRTAESHRDTVEAIVVAFILALVVRGFEAQAFVIPTGSMAPTLMGRHKEITCPQCGFLYAVNASDEIESPLNGLNEDGSETRVRVHSGVCVNCRYQARLDETPSFKGDRILVMMFPYDLPFLPGSSVPERWDVVVFRYPEEPETSYIKRLVGLPGETIRIEHGDVYVKKPGEPGFSLARKPPRHLRAMPIAVYDDRFRPISLANRPEWKRWTSSSTSATVSDDPADQGAPPASWSEDTTAVGRYEATGSAAGEWVELRYRHLVPDPEQWDAVLADRPLPRAPRPTLVTDFYSYNTNLNMIIRRGTRLVDNLRGEEGIWKQPHWVGDLFLSATLEVKPNANPGSVRLELVKAGVPYRCEIDLATGSAQFLRGDESIGQAVSPIKGSGTYHVEFANIDDRLTLFVDGRLVTGPDGSSAEGFPYDRGADTPIPTEADLAPAAVAVRDAAVAVSDLVLKRDIYYTQEPGRIDYFSVWDDRNPRSPVELFDFLADPSQLANLDKIGAHEYPIGPDRFFMMGDNSPRSKDSRGWGSADRAWDSENRKEWEVPRRLITGKAFYIYWPHGVPFGPDIRLGTDTNLLFRPNIERMRWIR
jgi:signal peptidase I